MSSSSPTSSSFGCCPAHASPKTRLPAARACRARRCARRCSGSSARATWRCTPRAAGACGRSISRRLDHLYDVRLILECEAVRKLSAGNPRVALAGLEKIWLVAPRQRLTDGARVARLDEEFHGKLVAAAGNPELARLHQTITERIRIVRRLDFTHPERVVYTYIEHGADPARHPRAQAGEGHHAAARAHRAEQVRGAQDQPAPAAPRAPGFEDYLVSALPSARPG